ncbi:MAG TPA: G/U mismatch-specific DNA glycosylase [Gemmataceae bacterium]|nr:G/U mismatch-specific DNA glycosylase [Gemmataceae bacterium]
MEQLRAARGGRVPDVIAPGLRVLFCGINPGLYSAAIRHHFGRPGNRFWPVLHAAGFTPRRLTPFEERELPPLGYGITNLFLGASARADEITDEALQNGGRRLERKVRRYGPRFVAVLGVTAYRAAMRRPDARVGLQAERLGGARAWVLPNPSGLNAHYQLGELVRLFQELREAAEAPHLP